jgi:putative ABC transport system ATP-binding protein
MPGARNDVFIDDLVFYAICQASDTAQYPGKEHQAMLQLQAINKSYRLGTQSLQVLRDIELSVATGELVSIMGSSGSGKSTLLNIIGVLDTPDSGSYLLDGKEVVGLSESRAADLRSRKVGFVFQSFNLLGFKNALENVALPLYYQNISRRKRNVTAAHYLDLVGLTDWAHHLPSELSGGQRQRVAIARALIAEPSIILADEPTGALDSGTSAEVMQLLKRLNAEGKTILVVTHERDIASQTDRVIYLRDGMVVEQEPESSDVQP